MKWTIDQVCIFLGMPRGIAFEECSSSEEPQKKIEEKKEEKKEEKEEEKENVEEKSKEMDDNDDSSSSSSCIEIVAAANTTYRDPNAPPKPVKPVKKTPEEIREELMEAKRKIIAEHPNFKYTAEDEADDEPAKNKKKKVEPKFNPALLNGMDNEALSKQYGFSENVVGKTFNNPTEVKKAERIFTILGFDIKKIKYPVIVQYTKTKKIEYYTPEQVREYFKNPISTDKKI
jgi:hypothetical protein